MKNTVKAGLYAAAGSTLLAVNSVAALNTKATSATNTGENSTTGTFVETLDSILGYLVWLLYLIAVVFALYAGFQILTAGWDEEKVKSGKTTLINAVIGLIVIFLASQIVNWIIGLGTTVIT